MGKTLRWSSQFSKTVILEEGMDYKALSMNPDEIQMNETMSRTDSKICTLFGVPESMIDAKQINTILLNKTVYIFKTHNCSYFG